MIEEKCGCKEIRGAGMTSFVTCSGHRLAGQRFLGDAEWEPYEFFETGTDGGAEMLRMVKLAGLVE